MSATVALVLASVALAIALTAAALAVTVMRQNATTTTDLRTHRTAHQRTTGRPDPDPEHHGTSPTVTHLADDVKRINQDLDTVSGVLEQITSWAQYVDDVVRPPDTPATAHAPATQAMPTTTRPAPRHQEPR
jgi:hypothetical protein